MNTKKVYRNGPLGALMDEYERVSEEYFKVLENISSENFTKIIDSETKDEDCRSIQTIAQHVFRSGYGYSNMIRSRFNEAKADESKTDFKSIDTPQKAIEATKEMLKYAAATLNNKLEISDEKLGNYLIKSRWGVVYDVEQLMEHAVLHVMRHRRQIEKLMQKATSAQE